MVTHINGSRIKIGLGVSVPFTGWDKKRQKSKNGSSHLQPQLDASVKQITDVYDEMERKGVELTRESFKVAIKRVQGGNIGVAENVLTFSKWIENFIISSENGDERQVNGQAVSHRTVQKYRTVQKQLSEFSKKVWSRQIEWTDVDGVLLNKYKKFRADQGLGVNTIAKDQAVLKFWMKTSYNRDVHSNKKWREKTWTKQEMRIKKPALSEDELKMLREAPMVRESLNQCRDLFLVSCWTGARISDLKRMPEIIREAWNQNGDSCPSSLSFVQSKTLQSVMVPVLPELRTIIEKWGGDLPELPAEQKMNKRIKEVGEAAGLDRIVEVPSTKVNEQGLILKSHLFEMLTNHTGRRTFATLLYKKGIMSNGQLMSLTGHSSETAFLRYLDITQEEISGVAMKLALNAFN